MSRAKKYDKLYLYRAKAEIRHSKSGFELLSFGYPQQRAAIPELRINGGDLLAYKDKEFCNAFF